MMARRLWMPAFLAMNLLVVGGILPASGATASCTLDHPRLERGEARPFLICGAGITAGSVLEIPPMAGVRVNYQQALARCGVDVPGPGLHVWLEADASARSTTLQVRTPAGERPCTGLALEVPDRLLLPPARLDARGQHPGSSHRLTVSLGTLVAGPDCRLRFPPDRRWPLTRVAGPEQLAACAEARRSAVRVPVTLAGEQRFPVPVIVTGVRRPDGSAGEGIAWFQPPSPAWESALAPEAARYRQVLGYRTRYFDSEPEAGPDRDTVILVHGGQPDPVSPTAESWRPNFPELARRFRVIAYDALGHGATDNPRRPEDYARYYELIVEHLQALVADLGLRRVHLVGHSQGGWPALRFALDRPDLVKCLVSVDSVMAPFTRDTPAIRYFAYGVSHIHPAAGPTAESLLRGEEFIARTLQNISWQEAERKLAWSRQPKLLEAKAAMGRIAMSPGNPYFRRLRTRATESLGAGELKVPHLLVWGREDQLAPLDLGLNLYASASARANAPVALYVISPAGHSPQVEQPAAFNSAVGAFCGQFLQPAGQG